MAYLFFLLAVVAIVSAAGMILQKNAVHSALLLIVNFGCVALLFLMLDAPFISMVQIAVYAGAIMVLFLFVIMLLGAEQTTDTEARQFGWLSMAATVLGVLFLGAMAFTLVPEGGLNLPEAPGNAPRLRLIHAANANFEVEVASESSDAIADVEIRDEQSAEDSDETSDDEPQTVTVSQPIAQAPVDVLVGDISFDDLEIGDVSSFREFEAGEYNVVVIDDSGTTQFETTVPLETDDVITLIFYGEEGFTSTAIVNSDLSDTEDNAARINVMNLVTDDPLYLVDLGSDRQLDVGDDGINDAVLTDALVFGEVQTITLPDGSFNLRFVQETEADGFVILPLIGGDQSWSVAESTEQTLIIAPDYNSIAGEEGYRAATLTSEIEINEPFGAPGDIGALLFIDYLLPVNLVGFLLLVALVGVIVLTRPEGATTSRRSTLNRRRKVSRPLLSVITQQTGHDVVVETPKLDEPGAGD